MIPTSFNSHQLFDNPRKQSEISPRNSHRYSPQRRHDNLNVVLDDAIVLEQGTPVKRCSGCSVTWKTVVVIPFVVLFRSSILEIKKKNPFTIHQVTTWRELYSNQKETKLELSIKNYYMNSLSVAEIFTGQLLNVFVFVKRKTVCFV